MDREKMPNSNPTMVDPRVAMIHNLYDDTGIAGLPKGELPRIGRTNRQADQAAHDPL